MLEESIEALKINPSGFYIDCTLGEGGHSSEIHNLLSENGLLLSIDRDESAINFVKEFYKKELSKGNWQIRKSNFSNICGVVKEFNRKPNGILMDLGISSRQLEVEEKGFSYLEKNQPLDMRMDEDLGVTAKDLLNALSERELTKLFLQYGEERFSKKIAEHIKKSKNPINTVGDLLDVIYKVVPLRKHSGEDFKHPARRVFQALRIAVNDELDSLEKGLNDAYELLDKKGRIVIISFHSLEDKIVKKFAEKYGKAITKKPILPRYEEILKNKRSQSAKLRIIEKN